MSDWASVRLPIGGAAGAAAEDEAGLVARARGDPQVFALLYDRYVERVYRYCYRRLGSSQVAEDATSRTFCRALRALPGQRGSFAAWLFAIARNVVADAFLHEPPEPPGLDARPAPEPTPEEALLASEERRSLRAALATLTDEQREVIELRLAGLTGAETAQALGRSHGSVKMLQWRGLNRLRALLVGAEHNREGAHGPR